MLVFRPVFLVLVSTRKFLHITRNSDNKPVRDDANMMVINTFQMSVHCSLKLLTICYLESNEREEEGVIWGNNHLLNSFKTKEQTSSAVIFFLERRMFCQLLCAKSRMNCQSPNYVVFLWKTFITWFTSRYLHTIYLKMIKRRVRRQPKLPQKERK